MANLTLSIDNDLLEAGRRYAQTHQVSLNSLIRRLLKQTVDPSSNDWLDETFKLMAQAKVNSGGRKWKREDLYDV